MAVSAKTGRLQAAYYPRPAGVASKKDPEPLQPVVEISQFLAPVNRTSRWLLSGISC